MELEMQTLAVSQHPLAAQWALGMMFSFLIHAMCHTAVSGMLCSASGSSPHSHRLFHTLTHTLTDTNTPLMDISLLRFFDIIPGAVWWIWLRLAAAALLFYGAGSPYLPWSRRLFYDALGTAGDGSNCVLTNCYVSNSLYYLCFFFFFSFLFIHPVWCFWSTGWIASHMNICCLYKKTCKHKRQKLFGVCCSVCSLEVRQKGAQC